MKMLRLVTMGVASIALASCASRPATDVSDGLAACSAKLSQPQVARTVTFANATDETLSVAWMTPAETETWYFDLAPGESQSQRTFVGHYWVARGRRVHTACVEADSTSLSFSD